MHADTSSGWRRKNMNQQTVGLGATSPSEALSEPITIKIEVPYRRRKKTAERVQPEDRGELEIRMVPKDNDTP
jgi:hypothetical protein